jgi:ribonuclease HI
MKTIVYCDASIKRSIGCTAAVVIKSEKDTLFEVTEFIDQNNCRSSNSIIIGELAAILLALRKVKELNYTNHNICIYSDSLNDINLINTNKPLHGLEEIYSLKANFSDIKIDWLP